VGRPPQAACAVIAETPWPVGQPDDDAAVVQYLVSLEEKCVTARFQLIEAHLVSGDSAPGSEIGLAIDQTLTQDATGTTVMLELEAMGLDRVWTEVSVQYVDHNLLQTDAKNPDDHLFL
jgi:hypothetical protein